MVYCTGTDWEYASGGIAFRYASSDGSDTGSVAASVTGTYAQATLTGLRPATDYTVWAVATTATGATYTSAEAWFTTPQPATSHSGWLELPAKSTSSTAQEYTLWAGERNYTMYYDRNLYTALWVAYPLAAGHMGSKPRPGRWYENPNIPASQQINLKDGGYGVNVGSTYYARGHQIPNADRNGNSTMQKQVFYATNSTPQIQDKFNGGIWEQFETAVRGEVPTRDSLYIATGAVFRTAGGSESITYIRPANDSKQCPVPNYYFKVVLKVKRSGSTITSAMAVGAWFEHRQYSDSWTNYVVSVDEIERLTGFDFFANLPDDVEAAAEQNGSWSTFSSF